MKRALKIILILLVLLAIIATIAWLRARNTAVKNGGEAPTFREFISGKNTNVSTPQDSTDGLSAIFVDENTATPPSSTSTPTTGAIVVSRFTSGPTTPTQQGTQGGQNTISQGGATNGNLPGGGGTGSGSGGTGGGTGGGGTGGGGSTPPAPACSDEDLNITFTADEISRLDTLQQQFYDLAATLHTDSDIGIELENYNNFKAKSDQINELYAYCNAKSPLITNPAFITRVPTPFWRNQTRDRNGYMSASGTVRALSDLASDAIDPRNVGGTQTIIQRIFALDLW